MKTLFLQYRPRTFSDLVGQESIIKTLQNAIVNNKVAHAYLFAGSRGTGKTSAARIFAKALIAPTKTGEPDMEHPLIQQIEEGRLVDVIEIDAASNNSVDEIRSLREKVQFAPTLAPVKVYIIDEVHMLSRSAFNALLKTLEEPPDHAYFILATTELHKVLDTIISRCQVFRFNRFTLDEISGRLRYICKNEGITIDDASLELIARKAEGGLRDAIGYLEQVSSELGNNITADAVRSSLGITGTELLDRFYVAITDQNIDSAFSLLKEVESVGADFRSFGHDLLVHLRDKLHAGDYSQPLLQMIDGVQKAMADIKNSPIPALPFEVMVVRLCGEVPTVAPNPTKKVATSKVIEPVVAQAKSVAAPTPPDDSAGFIFEETPAFTAPPKPIKTPAKTPVTAAPVVSVQSPSSSPTPAEPLSFSQSKLEQSMQTIAKAADLSSFAKRSFLTLKPTIADGIVVFGGKSQFHLEKVDTPEVHQKITKALLNIFNQTISFRFAKVEALIEDVADIDDMRF